MLVCTFCFLVGDFIEKTACCQIPPPPWGLCGFRAHDYIESLSWPSQYHSGESLTHRVHARAYPSRQVRATGLYLHASCKYESFLRRISQLPCLHFVILQNNMLQTRQLWVRPIEWLILNFGSGGIRRVRLFYEYTRISFMIPGMVLPILRTGS